MTNNLVERLRYQADEARKNYPEVFRVSEEIAYEAADYIEKLEAANLKQSCIKVDDQMRIEKLEAENAELQSEVNIVRLAAKYAAKIRDARIEKLEAALRKIMNLGQSAVPDHWEARCLARDTARKALEGKND